MLHYEEDVVKEVKRTKNMLERAEKANNVRDKISRAYYACYHVMIAAIWLEHNLDEAAFETAHVSIAKKYKQLYSRTKKNHISTEHDVYRVVKKWRNLRASADYDIFTDDFENSSLEKTERIFQAMINFVNQHLAYIGGRLRGKVLNR